MSKIASFERNLNEYQISRAKLADEFIIVSGEESDLIGREVDKFIFKDCEKSFDEMINLKSENFINLAGVEIKDELIKSIKISINGYDESHDSLDFDLNLISLSVPYRYAISNGCFEMNIFLKEKREVVDRFLATFSYKFEANSGKERHVVAFVNEAKIYEQTCL